MDKEAEILTSKDLSKNSVESITGEIIVNRSR